MTCMAGGEYRYRVSVIRGSFTMEAKVVDYFAGVSNVVEALLEHLAHPGDQVVVSVFSEESED